MVQYDIVGIGNAIVDILSNCDDKFLVKHNLPKGGMELIDSHRAKNLYEDFGSSTECSGGSAANTLAAIASLGGNSAFIGRVANDEFGRIFTHDMKSIGVEFKNSPADNGRPTARCLICVTNDAERTMATYIGASAEIEPSDIDISLIKNSKIVYIEGYLWDLPNAKTAIRKALAEAKKAGNIISFSASDAFCVNRHGNEFMDIIASSVDILFANELEILALTAEKNIEHAVKNIAKIVDIAAITCGANGVIIANKGEIINIPTTNIKPIIDTTGAGDLFAAGFLYGTANDYSIEKCAKFGNICAGKIIQQMGARPAHSLADLKEIKDEI